MSTLPAAFSEAFRMLATLDADLLAIVWLSLRVSVAAVVVSALIALPFGAALAVARFPGRQAIVVVINAAEVKLTGRVAATAREIGAARLLISLAHEADVAVAQAVAEGTRA